MCFFTTLLWDICICEGILQCAQPWIQRTTTTVPLTTSTTTPSTISTRTPTTRRRPVSSVTPQVCGLFKDWKSSITRFSTMSECRSGDLLLEALNLHKKQTYLSKIYLLPPFMFLNKLTS